MELKRWFTQICASLIYNGNFFSRWTGTEFRTRACVPGLNCAHCPGAAAGCPLGTLQGVFAGGLQQIPFLIISGILLAALLLGRVICGWLCPFGLLQEICFLVPSPKLKRSRWTDMLSRVKYFTALFFVIIIPLYFFAAESRKVWAFCRYICPNGALMNLAASAAGGELAGFALLLSVKAALLLVFFICCIIVFRPFCRFVCPLGALYGLFSRISVLAVRVDKTKCSGCGACMKVCPVDCREPGDRECIACGRCSKICPSGAVSLGCRYGRQKNQPQT